MFHFILKLRMNRTHGVMRRRIQDIYEVDNIMVHNFEFSQFAIFLYFTNNLNILICDKALM
ncbi:hypothetical protein KSF78_0000960 [Schistosoma japonicum]|nr:hypothetical protein KSF78_0000960 [Schistosoma japonicum]